MILELPIATYPIGTPAHLYCVTRSPELPGLGGPVHTVFTQVALAVSGFSYLPSAALDLPPLLPYHRRIGRVRSRRTAHAQSPPGYLAYICSGRVLASFLRRFVRSLRRPEHPPPLLSCLTCPCLFSSPPFYLSFCCLSSLFSKGVGSPVVRNCNNVVPVRITTELSSRRDNIEQTRKAQILLPEQPL